MNTTLLSKLTSRLYASALILGSLDFLHNLLDYIV